MKNLKNIFLEFHIDNKEIEIEIILDHLNIVIEDNQGPKTRIRIDSKGTFALLNIESEINKELG